MILNLTMQSALVVVIHQPTQDAARIWVVRMAGLICTNTTIRSGMTREKRKCVLSAGEQALNDGAPNAALICRSQGQALAKPMATREDIAGYWSRRSRIVMLCVQEHIGGYCSWTEALQDMVAALCYQEQEYLLQLAAQRELIARQAEVIRGYKVSAYRKQELKELRERYQATE